MQPDNPYRHVPPVTPPAARVQPRASLRKGVYTGWVMRHEVAADFKRFGAQSERRRLGSTLVFWAMVMASLFAAVPIIKPLLQQHQVQAIAPACLLGALLVLGAGLRALLKVGVYRDYQAAECLRLLHGIAFDPNAAIYLRVDLAGRSRLSSKTKTGELSTRERTEDPWLEVQGPLTDGASLSLRRVDTEFVDAHSHARVVVAGGNVRTDYTTHASRSYGAYRSIRVHLPPNGAARVARMGRLDPTQLEAALGGRAERFTFENGVVELSVRAPWDLLDMVQAVYRLASPELTMVSKEHAEAVAAPWEPMTLSLRELWGMGTRQKGWLVAALLLLLGALGSGCGARLSTESVLNDLDTAQTCDENLSDAQKQCGKGGKAPDVCGNPAVLKERKKSCSAYWDGVLGRVPLALAAWVTGVVFLGAAVLALRGAFRSSLIRSVPRPT